MSPGCTDDGIRCTWLDTSHAFHSELLEPALDEFESYARRFEFAVPTLPLVCNRTGAVLTADNPAGRAILAAAFPAAGAVRRKRPHRGAAGLLGVDGDRPATDSDRAATQAWPEYSATPRAIASLRKGVDARLQIAEAVAAVYVAGHRPEFAALHHRPRRRVELPTYPFQHRRYWPKTSDIRTDGAAVSGILGFAQDLASGDVVYTSRLSVKSQPWLSDHVIYGTVVVPGATYAAMALAAVPTPAQVRDVYFYEPIILSDKNSREVQLTLHPIEDGGSWTFQVHSRPYGDREAEWSLNAEGTLDRGHRCRRRTDTRCRRIPSMPQPSG